MFFPNSVFAWVFVVTLIGLLAAAAWFDLKRFFVPKAVTLGMLALGLVMNTARGGWNGSLGRKTWLFVEPTTALGVVDGFLFAVCGFLVGFGVYFLLWILGIAGGGDVKVVAALGSWLGPYFILGALLFTFPVVVVLFLLALVVVRKPQMAVTPGGKKKRLMGYSLPLAVATTALLLYGFRFELGLLPAPGP